MIQPVSDASLIQTFEKRRHLAAVLQPPMCPLRFLLSESASEYDWHLKQACPYDLPYALLSRIRIERLDLRLLRAEPLFLHLYDGL